MISYQLKLSTDMVTKYTLMIAFGCLVLTLSQIVNKVNYIGSTYAIGAILTGRNSHIYTAMFIMGFGCSIDIIHLITYSSKSSWVFIKVVQFITRLLGFMFEIVTIVSLHCYWKYTEEIKKQPEKSWFQHKLGQIFSNN
ncbi:uncharacterized protein LOC132920015 [Rhopalosiphum padi]|uniref:uncharacterized protein LOC132920015 n=1 Tax=Rhopalosiphum padi TaxID=40932 RepID=UPI00298E51CF|nr:uncharacterized protein LOC132920015 [Rhopalosiphum padi]